MTSHDEIEKFSKTKLSSIKLTSKQKQVSRFFRNVKRQFQLCHKDDSLNLNFISLIPNDIYVGLCKMFVYTCRFPMLIAFELYILSVVNDFCIYVRIYIRSNMYLTFRTIPNNNFNNNNL